MDTLSDKLRKYEMTSIWQSSGNLKRETGFLLIAAQNNGIRKNWWYTEE